MLVIPTLELLELRREAIITNFLSFGLTKFGFTRGSSFFSDNRQLVDTGLSQEIAKIEIQNATGLASFSMCAQQCPFKVVKSSDHHAFQHIQSGGLLFILLLLMHVYTLCPVESPLDKWPLAIWCLLLRCYWIICKASVLLNRWSNLDSGLDTNFAHRTIEDHHNFSKATSYPLNIAMN